MPVQEGDGLSQSCNPRQSATSVFFMFIQLPSGCHRYATRAYYVLQRWLPMDTGGSFNRLTLRNAALRNSRCCSRRYCSARQRFLSAMGRSHRPRLNRPKMSSTSSPMAPGLIHVSRPTSADHDHLLLGGDSDTVAISDPTSNGVGALPDALFQTGGHSNRLIPVFAKGPGSNLLGIQADQEDPRYGAYLDQAELFRVFVGATTPQP